MSLTNILSVLKGLVGRKLYIMLEGYAMAARGSAVHSMAEIRQEVLMAIESANLLDRVCIVPPMSWKACLAVGAGRLDKVGVAELMMTNWPKTKRLLNEGAGAHNYFDAYAMATVIEEMARHTTHGNPAITRLKEREGIRFGKGK